MKSISHRYTGAILHSCETAETTLAVVIDALAKGANLSGADLTGAYLTGADLTDANLGGADLSGADLTGAYLTGAYLTGADLTDANLGGADLSGADLTGAYLTGAYLTGADLTDANLTGAYLTGADLTGADLTGAYLRGAYLTPIRDDFWAVLSSAPGEVLGLRAAIIDGRIDGSTYSGSCACLVGTIANVRGCDVDSLGLLRPHSERPAERFFLCISPGDKPDTNQVSAIVLEWLDAWVAGVKSAFGSAA